MLYNSLTRQKDVLFPNNRKSVTTDYNDNNDTTDKASTILPVSMYTCGPTVYDSAHVGNFRAFLTYDLVKRVLMYLGILDIVHVCNITDVDDKIIVKANQLQLQNVQELTRHYEQQFLHDLQQLNCIPATHYPRATDYIPDMLRFIRDLHQRQLAYATIDGSWYFDTQQSGRSTYGQQLVQLTLDDLVEQKETENANGKRHWADFCLWKAFKEGFDRDDLAWSSADIMMIPEFDDDDDVVIAKGRPGWHLECSAMARALFPDQTLDLHGGGMDLKFPHHENEIAQSQGVLPAGQAFCQCWFHNGFVEIGANGEKMSKSLGNFRTLQELCPTALDIRAYRYLVISSQYRNPLRLSEQALKAAKSALQRMDSVQSQVKQALASHTSQIGDDVGSDKHHITSQSESTSDLARRIVPETLRQFEVAITDDLSMPRAAAALFSLIKAAEQELKQQQQQNGNDKDKPMSSSSLDIVGLQAVLQAIEQMDQVFGIFYQVPEKDDDSNTANGANVPDEVMELVGQRSAAKEAKDWELADSLRQRIAELGFTVKDVKGGAPIVTPVES